MKCAGFLLTCVHQTLITMKRLMTILLTLLVMGCGKEAQMQTISIGFSGITSGQMTKEVAQSGVSELISSTFPTSGLTFTLTSTTQSTRVYSVGLGEEVTVPIDEYKVTASFKPQEKGKTFKNGSIYAQPKFSVNETITVTNLQSEYEVAAIYGCWALVIDPSETKKYQHMGYSYSMEDFTYFVYSGDLGIAFISGTWTTDPYKILAVAKEPVGHEDKEYRIVTDKNYDGVFVENGKWYCFGAAEVEDASGALSLRFPEWEQGTSE